MFWQEKKKYCKIKWTTGTHSTIYNYLPQVFSFRAFLRERRVASFGGKQHPRVPSPLIDPARSILGIVRGRTMTRCKCVTKNDNVNTSPAAFWREGIRCPGLERGTRLRSLRDSHTRRLHASRSPWSFLVNNSLRDNKRTASREGDADWKEIASYTTWRHRALQRGSPTPMPPETKTNDSSLASETFLVCLGTCVKCQVEEMRIGVARY